MSEQNTKFECPKENCDKEYGNIVSLSKHWSRSHSESRESLYLALNKLEEDPTCACGCGALTKFLDAGRGYSDYILGHASRVKNNFVSKKAQENSLKKRQKMFANGELKVWNSGLTKETDKRVQAHVEKSTQTIRENPEELVRRSERMKKGRLDGTVRTLHGKDHSQWKGGVSSLNHTCRANGRLYRGWVRTKLSAAKFQCENCKGTGRLEVHHDAETFSSIMRRIALQNKWEKGLTEALNYNDPNLDDLKKKISNEVAAHHINNNVSGLVLCKSCHKKEHERLRLLPTI